MRAVFLITLVAFGSFAQGRFARINERCAQGRSNRGLACDDLAFFEFAPPSGAGMGTACACAAITGAKGEALTFTRAGDATCSRQGLATTGIANGDLVVCTANQPRVESSGGVLGLRVEGARTNINVRSEAFDNAAYTPTGVGAAAPATPTADTATAPSNAVTADTLVLPATTAGQTSIIRGVIGGACAAAQCAYSVYVRGVSGSGTVDIGAWGATVTSGACAFVDTSWTRCTVIATISGTPGLYIGNDTANNGGTNRPAQSVYVWGGQQEPGAYATSYIPTVTAAVTRNADDAYFDLSTFTLGNLSLAATAQTPSTAAVRRLHGALTKAPDDGANFIATYQDSAVLFGQFLSTAGSSTWNTGLATTTGPVRAASFLNGASVGACINGTCATNPIGTFNPAQITSPRRLRIGAYSTTNGNIDGVATLVCLQPDDPTRCR